jgi:hypothetical protein
MEVIKVRTNKVIKSIVSRVAQNIRCIEGSSNRAHIAEIAENEANSG